MAKHTKKRAKNGRRKTAKSTLKTRTRLKAAREHLAGMNPFNALEALASSKPKTVLEVYDARSDAMAVLARAVESSNAVLVQIANHLTSAPNYSRAYQTLR